MILSSFSLLLFFERCHKLITLKLGWLSRILCFRQLALSIDKERLVHLLSEAFRNLKFFDMDTCKLWYWAVHLEMLGKKKLFLLLRFKRLRLYRIDKGRLNWFCFYHIRICLFVSFCFKSLRLLRFAFIFQIAPFDRFWVVHQLKLWLQMLCLKVRSPTVVLQLNQSFI